MRLPAYPKYKPSGIEWLGDVPKHWDVKRLKMAVRLTDKKVEADEENPVPYVGLENIESWTGRLLPINPEVVPTGTANEFEVGSTLFGKLRPYLAKACNPEFAGLCSTELLVLKGTDLDRRALLYFLLADGFIKSVDSSTYGSKMPRASWDFIGNCGVPVATPDEQRAIAEFLDSETGKIDSLVEKKRSLIERLKEKRTALISRTVTCGLPPEAARAAGLDPHPKLKPSGIDWLGEVPEHWEIKRLGHISNVVRGASPRPAGDPRYFDGDFIPWITVGELTKDSEPYLTSTKSMLTEDGAALSRMIREGTLLLTNSGATLGVPKILSITGCANDGVVGFENLRDNANKLFLYYFFTSITGNLRDRIKQGSGQPNLNTDIIRGLATTFPPASEQGLIVDFLVGETKRVDSMVAKVETAIECLQEYRTALITAAVTGKIDVRGVVI